MPSRNRVVEDAALVPALDVAQKALSGSLQKFTGNDSAFNHVERVPACDSRGVAFGPQVLAGEVETDSRVREQALLERRTLLRNASEKRVQRFAHFRGFREARTLLPCSIEDLRR